MEGSPRASWLRTHSRGALCRRAPHQLAATRRAAGAAPLGVFGVGRHRGSDQGARGALRRPLALPRRCGGGGRRRGRGVSGGASSLSGRSGRAPQSSGPGGLPYCGPRSARAAVAALPCAGPRGAPPDARPPGNESTGRGQWWAEAILRTVVVRRHRRGRGEGLRSGEGQEELVDVAECGPARGRGRGKTAGKEGGPPRSGPPARARRFLKKPCSEALSD
uniref:Uncharacterized protein n=1 Tax=Streptomyces sp. 14R-10 TaxID=1442159 RepID=W0FTT7_9ACTN|nr:hypothetical protein pZL1.75c [Streptomyces sp. 14R-10]